MREALLGLNQCPLPSEGNTGILEEAHDYWVSEGFPFS